VTNYKYGQFSPEHLKKIREGIELFNEQKYWECHEVLEDLWIEDTQDSARFIYWAIIQVAAACIHYRDHNLVGARGLANKAREKFQKAREKNALTDLVFQYLDWEELEQLVMTIPQNPELEDFLSLFNFRFKNYP
jgi:predicted metal-dependent hydrolase